MRDSIRILAVFFLACFTCPLMATMSQGECERALTNQIAKITTKNDKEIANQADATAKAFFTQTHKYCCKYNIELVYPFNLSGGILPVPIKSEYYCSEKEASICTPNELILSSVNSRNFKTVGPIVHFAGLQKKYIKKDEETRFVPLESGTAFTVGNKVGKNDIRVFADVNVKTRETAISIATEFSKKVLCWDSVVCLAPKFCAGVGQQDMIFCKKTGNFNLVRNENYIKGATDSVEFFNKYEDNDHTFAIFEFDDVCDMWNNELTKAQMIINQHVVSK